MKFSTTLVATFASLSVAAPAHKRQTDDATSMTTTTTTEVLPGITGEEPVEEVTSSSSSTSDALAAADPFEIYRSPPAVPPTFPIEQNDLTGIQGQGVASIDDSDDIVDAAISNLSGTAPPIPLTTGTPTSDSDADAITALDFADDDDDDTDIEDLDVSIPPIPLSTATATTTSEDDGILSLADVLVDDKMAEEMIAAAVRAAQQLPSSPLSTGTPTNTIYIDPYLGAVNTTSAGTFGNSTTTTTTTTTTDAVDTTVDSTDLTASLQSLTDALSAYQDLMNTGTIVTDPTDPTTTEGTAMQSKIKMLGDDMLSGIQTLAKLARRGELAEKQNKKMKKVLMQRGAMQGMGGMFANKTESVTTSKSVMDKMGKGVLERYARMVAGGGGN
ncbi:hypothetical protein B0T20DRAFT_199891 [Sordaria brevicollis]|uniref:Uncharacterized protein n=1 Tax=Sordaria brevicollis TaxID=83679 RepID=A0AAE0PGT7_SORBR|nr:hypothetical protein B0T20DRAFT_199891 [Sordaria brevicollis]